MKWTQQEIDYLITNKHKPIKELSIKLNKSHKQIYNKRDALGISKQKSKPLLNQQHKHTIRQTYKTKTISEISKEIGVKHEAVYKFLRANKLIDEYYLIHSLPQELKETMDTVTSSNYEHTIQEISKTLNIEPNEVIEIYSEAMRKMVDYVKSNKKVSDELFRLMHEDENYDCFLLSK